MNTPITKRMQMNRHLSQKKSAAKQTKEKKKKKREEKEIYYPVNLYIYTLSPIAYQLLQTCKQGVDVV